MRYALPLALFATPALAHPGNHMHPQDIGFGFVIVGLALIVAAVVAAMAVRR